MNYSTETDLIEIEEKSKSKVINNFLLALLMVIFSFYVFLLFSGTIFSAFLRDLTGSNIYLNVLTNGVFLLVGSYVLTKIFYRVGIIRSAFSFKVFYRETLKRVRYSQEKVNLFLKSFLLGIIFFFTIPQLVFTGLTYIFPEGSMGTGTSDTTSMLTGHEGSKLGIFFLSLLVSAIVAPIAEEIFYRGTLLRGLVEKLDQSRKTLLRRSLKVLAVLLSSALFSAVHYQGLDTATDYAVLIVTFLAGIFNSFIYLRCRSIVGAIGAHSGYNATVTVFSVL